MDRQFVVSIQQTVLFSRQHSVFILKELHKTTVCVGLARETSRRYWLDSDD